MSQITPFVPSRTSKVALYSQVSNSPSKSVSSSSNSSSSAAPNEALTSRLFNTTATLSTILTSRVTSQASFSTSSAILVSTGTTGTISSSSYSVPITTTITSPPFAYFTSIASNSDWTTDTAITIDGTILPVLVGCSVCGGSHHGLVIGGLGGGPLDPVRPGCGSGSFFGSVFGCGSEFDIPPLPPFVIESDGKPLQEATGGDDSDGEKACEDEDSCTLTMSKPRKTQGATTSTPIPTSTSSLTSSSVSKTMTSTSGGLSSEYMVFPTAGTTPAELTALTRNFTEELGSDNVLPVSLSEDGDDFMYILYMSGSFASNLQRSEPKVCNKFLRALMSLGEDQCMIDVKVLLILVVYGDIMRFSRVGYSQSMDHRYRLIVPFTYRSTLLSQIWSRRYGMTLSQGPCLHLCVDELKIDTTATLSKI